MKSIIKYTLIEPSPIKIRLPKKAMFVKLKVKQNIELYFLSLGGYGIIEKTFQVLQTSEEIAKASKKQYLGSCNEKKLHLFEIAP